MINTRINNDSNEMKKLLIILSFLLTSCGVMPPKTVYFESFEHETSAELVTLGEGYRDEAYVTHINGKLVFAYGFSSPSMGIILKPGEYELTILHFNQGYASYTKSEAKITKNLKAGHSYSPSIKFLSNTMVQFELIDHGTNYPIECLSNSKFQKRPHGC